MLLSQELERLNNNLRNKVEEYNNLENKFRSLQNEYENSRRGASDLEYKLGQINHEHQAKISSFESILNQAGQENN